MRKIMFRGKRKEGWVEGCYQRLVVHGVMRHFILPCSGLMFDDVKLKYILIEVDPSTIGQFTGCADKNVEDIYEGDIIPMEHQATLFSLGMELFVSLDTICRAM